MAMRTSLLLSTALTAALALPAPAQAGAMAQPQGGQVVAGAAAIAQTPTVTTITQSSQNAAINWQSFNVGSAQTVAIQQPNAQSMTLNRVVGPAPSVIAGHITANGGVAIVNQSGVVFTPGSQVDVQTLVVSTANISNTNFMAGKLAFDVPGKPNAAVVNQGTITVKQAGLAALVAPSVRNTGLIQAKLGHVVLAGAEAATLDLYGDGLVSIDVTKQVTRAPVGPGGKPVEALVTNTGTIRAEGGTVQLTAAAADGVVQNLVSAGGTISVNGGRAAGGTIALAGVGGSMVIEGALTATGATGGTVQAVTDGAVTVAAAARIDASGRRGGGTVSLGGSQAASVTVAQGAALKANATRRGNGGRVAVLARDSAVMNGSISARGGPHGGNGGTVEVSGASVGITGSIDTAAPAGLVGTILLDPDFLTIVSGVAGTGAQDPTFIANGGTVPNGAPSVGTDTITAQVISAFTGNVLLEANQSITVANGVRVNLTSASSQNLVLEAGGTITVAAGATLRASGNVVLETGDAVSFVPPLASANPLVQINGTVASTHGDVFINAGTGGTIALGAAGLVSVAVSGKAVMSLVSDTLALTPGAQLRGVTLDIAPASMGTTVTLGSAGLGSLDGIEVTTLVLGGALAPGGSAPVVRAGNITVTDTFYATVVETLELLGTGAITQTAPLLNVGVLTGQAGTITLINAANSITGLGSLSASAGGLAVASTIPFVVTGPVAAGAGNVTLSAPDVALDGAVRASGQIGLQADTLSVAGGSLTAPLVELAPLTAGTVVSLGGAGGLSLASMAGISATTLRLGGVTLPAGAAPTITAGSISIAGAFDATSAATLDLLATGAVSQSAALTEPGTLAGSVGSLSLTDAANRIGTLGAFASAGALALSTTGPTLTVAGPVVAGGSVTLSAGGNIIETGSLSAVSLTGSAGGRADLAGANSVGTLGNFSAGGDFVFKDSSTLTVSGVVAAGTAAAAGATPNTLQIDATGLLSITGSLTSGSAGSGFRGGNVVLNAAGQPGGTTGAVAVSGSVAAVANGTGGADSITVTAPTIAIGGTLSATSDLVHAVAGLVRLQADTLSIGGTVSVPGGMVTIAPLSLDALAVAAAPVAGALTLAPADLQRIGLSGTGTAAAGSGELVLGSPEGATASVGTLALQAALALPGVTTLGLFSRGAITQDPAAPLTVSSLVGEAGRISLPAANAIATIGRAGVAFAPAGTPAYAGLTASGDIDLNNVAALSVVGPIGLVSGLGTANSGASLTLTEGGALLVDGPLGNCGTGALTVSAEAITLGVATAPTLWSLGTASLSAAGALVLRAGVLDGAGIALGGTVSQSGGVIASSGSLSLAGPFTQSAGTLIAAGALSQSGGTADLGGVVAAGSATLGATTVSGMLTTGGNLTAAALAVTAGTVAAGGALTVGSGTAGIATAGGFAQSGGTVLAAGDITVWSTGTVVQTNGILAAGGTLSLTAAALAQGMGSSGSALISGGAAVRLYAASGDVRQGQWGTLAAAGAGIVVQAPAGEVTVWDIAPAAALTGGTTASQAFVCAAACAGIPGVLTAGAPVSLAGATGRVNVALLGNAIDLFADAAPGSAGPLVLTAGTLSLISRLATTEAPGNPVIDALLVTGSAGSAVQLGALTGGGTVAATLTNANRIATLGPYVATGGLSVTDATALTVTGPVRAAGDVVLAAAGALRVPGSVAGADVMLVANENLLNGSAAAPADLSITGAVTAGSVSLDATGDVTLTGGVVRGSTVTIATTGDKILNSGLIASTGGGIDLTGGPTVVYGGTISATGTGSLTTAALVQYGGTISANGSASLASLIQSAGILATVGDIAIAGALSQSGGTVSSGGTLGAGTGTAGLGGSAAGAGALQQTGGTLLASGDVVLWSASPAVSQQSGIIAAGGRVGMTATAGIAQRGGTLSGAGGVALLANTGDLTQDATGVLAGPAATGAGAGVMAQAPQGNTDAVTVLLAGAVGAATPASTGNVAAVSLGPLGAQGTARVDVLLLGDSIALDKNLTAGALGLYSLGDTRLDAGRVIDALVLQGSAGWSAGWTVPAATGWTGAPLGWTAGTGSAVLGGTGVPLTTADQTLSNLNLIPTLASYAATGNLSLADAGALDVTGPVQVAGSTTLAAGGTLTLAGSLAAADALLIANHALGNLTAPADLLLSGTVVVPGTLELWAERNLTATGPITAGVLAARAGGLAGDTTLPANFRHDLVGTIALTGGNAIATIGPVLATGNVTIDTATTVLSGPLVAGYGGLAAAPTLDLQVAGDLTATGQVASPGGTATIAASGAVTLTDALVFAPTAVNIAAGTEYAQTGGAVVSDSVTIAAPARTLDGGAILAPGPAASIDLAGGCTTVTDGGVISAGGATALVRFGTLNLAGGTVASAGALQADAVVQQAGTIAAVGNAQFGSLQQQAGGLLAIGGDLTVGTGTGTAGQVGSQASSGAVAAAGGVDVAGTLTLWSADGIGLSGTVLAGRVLATAAGTIAQSAGTLVGGTGVALLATAGDAAQDAASGAVLAGGTTYGVAVRAPLGTVSFGNITLPGGSLPAPPSVSLAAPSLTCTVCMVPLPLTAPAPLPLIGTVLPASSITVPAPLLTAQPAGSAIPDVTLAGAAIQQNPPQVLTAGTLSLFATQSIDEQGTLVANGLTGTAGLAQPGQGLAATDPAAWVHLDGSANSIATLGDFTSTDVLRLTDARPLTIPDSTISAPLVRLLVSDGITIQGGVFIVGGETGLPPRGGLATDPTDATYTDDSQRGLYLAFTGATGQVIQTGLTQLEPIGALPALLRIDLPPGTANKVSFDPGLGLDYGLFGRTAAVFLHLGDGWASGNINVGQLAVIYSSMPPIQTRMTGTLLNAEGAVIGSQTAASQANIGMSNGQFMPSGIFQLNGCALTATSCIMIGQHDSVPVQSPLRPIDFGNSLDPREDPDLLAPNVSDRDY